jgi:hypothetical protein
MLKNLLTTYDNISAATPNGGKDISGATDMPASAWGLGIKYPQSIKRLGHFLTADCKSAGTPNGGRAYPAQRRSYWKLVCVMIQTPCPF